MEEFLESKPKLRAHTVKFGFGLRKPNELAEDFGLQTPIEQALYQSNFKTFELLYKQCMLNGNHHLVYKVLMRNLPIIMARP